MAPAQESPTPRGAVTDGLWSHQSRSEAIGRLRRDPRVTAPYPGDVCGPLATQSRSPAGHTGSSRRLLTGWVLSRQMGAFFRSSSRDAFPTTRRHSGCGGPQGRLSSANPSIIPFLRTISTLKAEGMKILSRSSAFP